jgi:REP element-mobilizing transposase RayT
VPQSFVCLDCHVVFSTKNRQPWIESPLADRLYAYLGGVFRAEGAKLVMVGGMPDHVHLLVSLGKNRGVADLLRVTEANSSKWIHETFPHMAHFARQTGYGAFAVSHSNVEVVRAYIAGQLEHHRTRSFQEEFVALLKRHGIAFDERYLWD